MPKKKFHWILRRFTPLDDKKKQTPEQVRGDREKQLINNEYFFYSQGGGSRTT